MRRPTRLLLPPGAYRGAPAWSGRQHWIDKVLPVAMKHGEPVLRAHHIASDTFRRVMAAHAQHADDGTGRGCTPTVEHLAASLGCSERTVQRARATARELGIVVEVFRGRHLNLEERLRAHRSGFAQRGWASEYALGCPQDLARHLPRPVDPAVSGPDSGSGRNAVERGTPPRGLTTTKVDPVRRSSTSARRADQRPAPRPSTGRSARSGPSGRTRTRWNPAGWKLALDLRQLVPALHHVHPGRLTPALTRFATATEPWSARQLQVALEGVLRAHDWSWLHTPQHPASYLARLLREIDPADQPDTAARSRAEQLRAQQHAQAAELAGHNLCAHGVGDADQNGRSTRCAFCRREAV